MKEIYDLIILGGGPAGLSSGIYASRSKLNTLIIEKKKNGGSIVNTYDIENYPGAIDGETGISLISRMRNQCIEFGCKFVQDEIVSVELESKIKSLRGKCFQYKCKSLIIATGSKPKELNIDNEKEFIGKGISYCSICDGHLFEGLDIVLIGSGESAAKEGLYLTKYANKVNIVSRSNDLKCSKLMKEKLNNNIKINIFFNKIVSELNGDGILEKIVFKDINTNEYIEFKAKEEDGVIGLFIFIGLNPETKIFEGILNIDNNGYIVTDENMKTNIQGVFAAGDCRYKKLRQVVTATSDGAIASISAEEYIKEIFM